MMNPFKRAKDPEGKTVRNADAASTGATKPSGKEPTTRWSCQCTQRKFDEQGFCTNEKCGMPENEDIASRNHRVITLGTHFAAVTDRGKNPHHPTNQDYVAIAEAFYLSQKAYIGVLTDGVSSSFEPESASLVAGCRARRSLIEDVRSGLADRDPKRAMQRALAAAQEAVCALAELPAGDKSANAVAAAATTTDTTNSAEEKEENYPATTIVAALVFDGKVTVGSVGDARAYWLGPRGCCLLTCDHTRLNEQLESGEINEQKYRELFEQEGHMITRWLGHSSDAALTAAPFIKSYKAPEKFHLVLGSDGEHNYAPEAEDQENEVRKAGNDADAQTVAEELVQFSRVSGGRDNISVIVLQRR